MRVAIDTRALRPPLTGIGHFVHRLLDAMLPLLAGDEELLSFNGWGLETLDRSFLARTEAYNSGQPKGEAQRPFLYAGGKAYVLLRQMYVARQAARRLHAIRFHNSENRFDLFHAVNYVPPDASRKPVLPVIYDLSSIRFPKMHPRERVEWLESELKRLANVPIVQTISEFSKTEIVELLGIPAHRVSVSYPAPGEHFRRDRAANGVHLAKYDLLSRKYFLFVGTREPRKNVKTVAEAYTALPDAAQAQFPLVWAGPPGWGDVSLSIAADRARQTGRIRLLGYVPDRDLAVLYRNAALFVMPSIYEGFGMPVVEAMACGARMALSKIPVFEEIAGGYAQYVEPMDVEAWRQVMIDAIDEEREASAEPRSQADLTRFSWRSSAATTLDLYRRLARNC